jgi:hypothetical protein
MRCILIVAPLLALGCAARNTPGTGGPPDAAPLIHATSTGVEVRLSNPEHGLSAPLRAAPPIVFDALISVMQDWDIDPDILDSRQRRYGANRINRSRIAGESSSDLLRCANRGAGPSAVGRLRIRLSVLSQVDPGEDGGSVLTTRVEGTATPVDGTSTSMVNCISTGKLEERIADAVRLVVAARAPAR